MASSKKHRILVIHRSCLTGKVVWVYPAPSKQAACMAYRRACRDEVRRARHWGETAAQRRANILKILNDYMAELPIDAVFTPEQREASLWLQNLSKEDIACHSEFYAHILEEERRRADDKEIRRKMRERKKNANGGYV